MAKNTKYLFFLSVILTFYSLIHIKIGGREFYPFYSWKLFSFPSGNKNIESEYRLYGIRNNDTIRINNTKSELFDENEKFNLINYYGNLIDKKIEVNKNKKELLIFANFIEPQHKKFLLVKELYHPRDLFLKPQKIFQKKIIILN